VLKNYDSQEVELLLTRKMIDQQQEEAAVRIQRWFKKSKHRAWFSLIASIRTNAAQKI